MINWMSVLCIGLFLFSCHSSPTIGVQKDPFSELTFYTLGKNLLDESYPTVNIEFNLQKTISKVHSEYFVILNLLGATTQILPDSLNVVIGVDGNTFILTPVYSDEIVKKSEYGSEWIFGIFNRKNPSHNYETLVLPISLRLLKQIAYGFEVQIKLESHRKFLKAHFTLENKINIQKFIESFVPLEEQISIH